MEKEEGREGGREGEGGWPVTIDTLFLAVLSKFYIFIPKLQLSHVLLGVTSASAKNSNCCAIK